MNNNSLTKNEDLILKVHTLSKPFFVTDKTLQDALIEKFGEKNGQIIYERFDTKMIARQRLKSGIYMQDVRQIMLAMNISVRFVNEDITTI